MLIAVLAFSTLFPPSARGAIREADLKIRMAALQRKLNVLATKMDRAVTSLEFARARIAEHQRELREASVMLLPLRAALSNRAREMYIQATGGVIETALTAPDIATYLDRTGYLELVSQGERGLLEKLRAVSRRARIENKALHAALLDAQRANGILAAQRTKLDRQLGDYKALMDLVHLGRGSFSRASRFRGGGFICPVAGPHALMNNFGAPRPGGPHTGDDLPSQYGTPVAAVLSGTITQIVYGGWMGLGIILRDVAGNEWWYAHLSSRGVSAGEHVSGGEIIGRVGCSGNCSGPHLHFEYHPGGGAPANPYRILSRAC
ncbi:MAG: murein hydrolase activator EnvC [Actinomycetota bacterium]